MNSPSDVGQVASMGCLFVGGSTTGAREVHGLRQTISLKTIIAMKELPGGGIKPGVARSVEAQLFADC